MIIRPAQHADLPQILPIVNHAIAHTTAIYDEQPRTLTEQAAWFDARMADGFPVMVAESGAAIAGFASFGTFKAKSGYRYTAEHSVYVNAQFQGMGIGGQLMTEIIRLARLQGLHNLVGVIDTANTYSIGFHQKFGFEICGTIRQAGFKFGRWLDVTYMQLLL